MAYIGTPVQQALTKVTSQSFNGTGSQTVFTLNRAVNTGEELEVFVNNVQQEPGVGKSYTATGTTLTFDAAPSSGTGNIYVIYRGLAEVTRRLEHDPNAALAATTGTFSGTVTATSFSGDGSSLTGIPTPTLTSLGIANHDDITVDGSGNAGIGTSSPSRKLSLDGGAGTQTWTGYQQAGTEKFVVGLDASGNPSLYGTQSAPMILYTNNTEKMRIDISGRVTTPYQPSFMAGDPSVTFTPASSTYNYSETYSNVGNHYNTSNGVFTAPVSGTYYFFHQVSARPTSSSTYEVKLYKNAGTEIARVFNNGGGNGHGAMAQVVVYLSANDGVQAGFYNGLSVVFSGSADLTSGTRYGIASGWGGYLIG